MAVDWLPSILKVTGIRAAVHLAVEFGVDNRAGVLVERIRVVANPGTGEERTRGLVLGDGAAAVVIVRVAVAQHKNDGGK